jgi:hypothetical protein
VSCISLLLGRSERAPMRAGICCTASISIGQPRPAKTLLQESAPNLTHTTIVIRECQPSCAVQELLTCSLPVAYSDKHVTKHSWRCLDVRSTLAGRAASFSSTMRSDVSGPLPSGLPLPSPQSVQGQFQWNSGDLSGILHVSSRVKCVE